MLRSSRSPSPQPLTHVEEQEKLRKETIAAFHDAVPEEEGDEFLVPRSKTKDELEKEEEEYRAFLEREVGDLKDLVTIDIAEASSRVEHGEEPSQKEPKKKKGKKVKGEAKGKKSKEETDQEFLME